MRCICGEMIRMPIDPAARGSRGGERFADCSGTETPGHSSESTKILGSYDLDFDGEHRDARVDHGLTNCPDCNQPLSFGVVLCMNCGFDIQADRKINTKVHQAAADPEHDSLVHATVMSGSHFTEAAPLDRQQMEIDLERQIRVKEIYVPLGLFGAAICLYLLNAFVLFDPQWSIAVQAPGANPFYVRLMVLATNAIGILIQFPLLFVAILITANLFSASYGPVLTASLKLVTVGAVVWGANACINSVLLMMTGGHKLPGMLFIEIAMLIAVFWPLCLVMFEMESVEVTVMFCIAIVLPWFILIFFVYPMLLSLLI